MEFILPLHHAREELLDELGELARVREQESVAADGIRAAATDAW